MPPRKAAPPSPPAMKLTSPAKSIVKVKRQLPDFIAKKTVRFEDIPEPVEEADEWVEDTERNSQNSPRYIQVNEASFWVREWLEAKTLEARRDAGEIIPTSDEEDYGEFNLGDCEEACGVTPKEIFDFIWEHLLDKHRDSFGSQAQLEYVLSCEPMDLLKYMQIALDVDEVELNNEKARKYIRANEAFIWLEEVIHAKKIESRLDAGEIIPGATATSPLEDGEIDDEFNIGNCEEACGVSPKEIFNFIWEHILDEHRDSFDSHDQLKCVLSREPLDLLKYLQIALDEAAVEIGPLVP